MDETNELPDDLSFDLSFLEDCCATTVEEKRYPDVVNNDVNLLDTTWLNKPSIGKNIDNNYSDDLGSFCVNSNNGNEADASSDTESLAGSECNSTINSAAPSPALSENGVKHFGFHTIDDDELVDLSVKDLNYKLKGYPKDSVTKYKRRRRTLKNRGYAHSCRQKRLTEKSSLQVSNHDLEKRFVTLENKMRVVAMENGKLRNLLRLISEQVDIGKIVCKA